METPQGTKYSTEGKLYIAMELGQSTWKLGMGTGIGQGCAHPDDHRER